MLVAQAAEVATGDNTLALVGTVCTLLGVLGAAFLTAISKKWRTPKDAVEAKTAEQAGNEALFKRFQTALADSDRKHAQEIADMRVAHALQISELRQQVDEISQQHSGVTKKNEVLTEYIYRIVGAARRHEFIEHIPEPPHGLGIYI